MRILNQYHSEYVEIVVSIVVEAIWEIHDLKTRACVEKLKRLIEVIKRRKYVFERVVEILKANDLEVFEYSNTESYLKHQETLSNNCIYI